MKLPYLVLAVTVALTGCGSQSAKPPQPDPMQLAFEQAQRAIAETLRDPEAARFRDLRGHKNERGVWVVCGEVNGKNLLGGYVGFRQFRSFIYPDDTSPMATVRDPLDDDNRLWDAAWSINCEGANPSILEDVLNERVVEAEAELQETEERIRRLQQD